MTSRTIAVILTILTVSLLRTTTTAKPQQIKPGCRYEGRRYQEGMPVITSEPCLQCRCTEGALRCRLRVCPRLPSPSTPGCRVRSPGENVCCAELVCGETRDTENTLRRSNIPVEEDVDDEENPQISHSEGCLYEGVRYGPGSAMMGSRRCEYCYCISGARRCIRPKCLLPLPGCSPLYAPHSCCPVAYNCTHLHSSTLAPVSGNGCRVGDKLYEEGEMVRDIQWRAACDNCFCAMGGVRCVPLSCAPPLQGCTPIVREGHCCPSTYNCSGSIEVKAAQNYASYAFISKDYAKFRKETNFFPAIDQTTNPPVEGRGHRVVEEHVDTSTIGLEEESSIVTDSTSWPSTLETDIMDNEILLGTEDYTKSSLDITTTTTASEELTTNIETATFDGTTAGRDDDSVTDSSTTHTTSIVEESTVIVTVTDDFSSADGGTTTESTTTTTTTLSKLTGNRTSEEKEEQEWEKVNVIERNKNPFFPTIATNVTELVNVRNISVNEEEPTRGNLTVDPETTTETTTESTTKLPDTKPSSTILMPDDILVMNVTVKTNVSVGHIQGVTINPIRSIPPDVEAILNITHREKGEDYDYDYSEPTLPPSLPNVRIIPFVAADALVKEKTVPSAVTGYPSGSVVVPPELRPTDTSGFYDIATQENRFSPPVETEGGFVPREPPYFDAPYHSTDLNLEIGTGVTVAPVAPITNPHRKNDANHCLFESLDYRHGEILPSSSICVICMCYYGEVVCSSEKCPPLKIGCRRINTEEVCCGKIVCVDADESPTVVLDRADATAASHRQPMVSPDPFRDVIKTEPAPDLPSLIEDMIPYLVEHGITTPRTASTTPLKPISNQASNRFDYMEKLPLIRPPYDYRDETDRLTSNNKYVNQETQHIKDTLPQNYKEHEQIRNNVPETIPSNVLFDVEKQTEKMNHTIQKYRENITTLLTSVNVTPSNSMKFQGNDNNEDLKPISLKFEEPMNVDSNIHSTTMVSTMEDDEDPIFSLDSVLDLLFSSDKTSNSKRTKVPGISTSSTSPDPTSVTSTSRPERPTEMETPASKVLDNEIPMSVASLLKLAGCNIYGRMYRVGRIITELSGPCLECRCTEIGVQCKQLEC